MAMSVSRALFSSKVTDGKVGIRCVMKGVDTNSGKAHRGMDAECCSIEADGYQTGPDK